MNARETQEIFSAFFPHTYCVNLDRRPDRWEQCQKKFALLNLLVERWPAIDGEQLDLNISGLPKGSLGNLITHINQLKFAQDENLENILIFEDDVVFDEDFLDIFSQHSQFIPDDWDVIYFGGNHMRSPTPFKGRLHLLRETYTTHAVAINAKFYDTAIKRMSEFSQTNNGMPIDVYLVSLMVDAINGGSHKILGFYPNITWQEEGFSDIRGKVVNYNFLKPENKE